MSARPDENDLNYEVGFFLDRSKAKSFPKKRGRKTTGTKVIKTEEIQVVKKKTRWGNAFQNTKTGIREDIGVLTRSSWEANYLRILKFHSIPFEFESRVFYFPVDARGNTGGYLPDIYLPQTNEYIEIKGWLDSRGRNKLRKFKRNYPEEFSHLTMVISKSNKANKQFCEKLGVPTVLYYEHLSKVYKPHLPQWEGR